MKVFVVLVGTNVPDPQEFYSRCMVQVIAAYLTGEKPQVEKAMRLLQGVRASNIMVAYRTLSDLMTACWNANKLVDADLLFQDMKAANYNIDPKV